MKFMAVCLAVICAAPLHSPANAQQKEVVERPRLTGTWTNASLTRLERQEGMHTLTVTEKSARELISQIPVAGISRNESDFFDSYSDPEAPPPQKGGEDFGVQGYDSFWVSPGESLAIVKGEYRTSYIVDPPDGLIPYAADGEAIQKQRKASRDRYQTGAGGNDGPEATNLTERCLLGLRQTGGPGMQSALYNNTYEFVQTDDHVLIVIEMVHDVRIIPIYDNASIARQNHRPAELLPWLGDSVGWYEDNALFIETTNVAPQQKFSGTFPVGERTVVLEKISRHSDKEIFYEFWVEDPDLYSKTWKAELSFYPAQDRQYEYACHEGNYAMTNILAGARRSERPILDE